MYLLVEKSIAMNSFNTVPCVVATFQLFAKFKIPSYNNGVVVLPLSCEDIQAQHPAEHATDPVYVPVK